MAKVMAVNAGSSSLKYKMYEMPEEEVICSGIVDRIGHEDGIFKIKFKARVIKTSFRSRTTPKASIDSRRDQEI
jgi:acetate kinase